MKLFFSVCLFALFLVNSYAAHAQKEVEIDGIKYIQHTVAKNETVFSLCQKYKVTQKELLQANPGLSAVLQNGTVLKIPVGKVVPKTVKEEPKIQAQSQTEEYYYHKVAKRQTIFSIAKQYGISANDLIRYNTELTNGLQEGQVLKIPVRITKSADQAGESSVTESGQQLTISDYTVHPVVSGETFFSLEHQYGISRQELLKYNPALQDGLKTGMKLKIPVKANVQPAGPASVPQNFTKYQVEKGETLFSLSTRFGIEVSELKNANPTLLSRSLEAGETILIPRAAAKNQIPENQEQENKRFVEEQVGGDCNPVAGANTKKYKVAFLLPLHLPGNEKVSSAGINKNLLLNKVVLKTHSVFSSADTTAFVSGSNIDPRAESFVEFYEGALLAIDSLQRLGMNTELFVFDASNQQMINALLQLDEFRELDLIVGPVYPELQGNVASFAAKNRIPMVSPLSAAGNFEENNPYYFKVNPTKEYQIEQTANYISDELGQTNTILLQVSGGSTSAESRLARLSKEKLAGRNGKKLFHEYSFQARGVNALKPLLDETSENVFIIPTDNEAQVSVAVTNLNAIAENFNVVLIGTSNFPKLKSIQTENFHRVRLRYLSPVFIDYTNSLTRTFVSRYRETFSGEPTQFSFQGFDVSYYFLSALFRYGKDFRSCLPSYPMELTQMSFQFRRVAPMSGFMNHGLFVTAWERNFDILNYGSIGPTE